MSRIIVIKQNTDKIKAIIEVSTGQVEVSQEGVILRSVAIGSCIVAAAYDFSAKTGGLAHIMLPGSAPAKVHEKTRYASDAIDEMVNRMTRAGSRENDIEVCLVGGANVLQRDDDTICEANIKSVTALLEEKNICIRALVLGGIERKSVFLDVENGKIFYIEGESEKKLLWEAGRRSEK